jgi:antibiotic biosynthesis monooxygenase (ABM) superfamily enzyme
MNSDKRFELGSHWQAWIRSSKRGYWLKRHDNPHWKSHLMGFLDELGQKQGPSQSPRHTLAQS